MSWIAISKRAVGACISKSWLDTFIDNLTFLYNAIGGSGTGASGSLQNGSFENDTDADGIPDGWTRTLYTGGSSAIETTDVAHGAKSYKFTSPGGSGNGGGYITSEDYILCSPNKALLCDFLIKSSVADIHNVVEVLFYDKAKGYLSTTTIYDNAATNPTDWQRYILGAVPPATVVFCKVRLTGAKNDDATVGSCYFDGVSIYDIEASGQCNGTISENSHDSTWADKGSVAIQLGSFSADCVLRINFTAECKRTNAGGAGIGQRFRIGSAYSNEVTGITSTSYAKYLFTLTLPAGTASAQTLYQQLNTGDGDNAYGKKVDSEITIEILVP